LGHYDGSEGGRIGLAIGQACVGVLLFVVCFQIDQ